MTDRPSLVRAGDFVAAKVVDTDGNLYADGVEAYKTVDVATIVPDGEIE